MQAFVVAGIRDFDGEAIIGRSRFVIFTFFQYDLEMSGRNLFLPPLPRDEKTLPKLGSVFTGTVRHWGDTGKPKIVAGQQGSLAEQEISEGGPTSGRLSEEFGVDGQLEMPIFFELGAMGLPAPLQVDDRERTVWAGQYQVALAAERPAGKVTGELAFRFDESYPGAVQNTPQFEQGTTQGLSQVFQIRATAWHEIESTFLRDQLQQAVLTP